ncbi:YadA-like family protein [Escherichia coli]|uniref:YadA-like family protein n=1 Tax=Escherichia coli TaxID=562 RepID=UPI001B072849|nr:YadA-like family protein [Escherichia coli]MDT4612035.1 YadA-like family protein [Escherichia coli]MDZ3865282.1 YadA-like family protein [Escherichia coli]HBA5889478.1 adhesin [Escherichia coli]
MNKIFKVIWNPATGSYSVASETAKSRGKKSGRSKLLISALVAGGLLSSFGASADNYTGQPTDYGDGSAGDGWVAIGKGSKANTFINTSGASTALGYDAIAEGEYSSAIGSKTLASGGASMAFGVSAKALGDRSVALGASSTATGDRSMALGRYAKTNGFTSLAVGDSSLADGEKTIALGNTAKAYEIMSIALGDNANASKEYSMALGASSAASAANAIAVGRNSAAAGVDSLALGRQSLASAANAITIGAESEAAENATAVGTKAKARGKNSLALGANSDSTGEGSVALGYTAAAAGASALALGQNAQASNTNTIALGQNSSASTANAIAIGTGSSAVGSNSLALGSSSSAGGNNSVAIGASSTADEDNVVSVGSGSAQRRIVNMAAGEISTDSKEAINGSQLYAISRSVADRLGGGADVASNGTIKGMSYKLKKRDFNNVGEALQYLDNETLHWDSAKGAFSASYIVKNADGTIASTVAENKIINVKDGDISATSKDAINGSQLKTTNDNVATNTTNITNLTDSVGDLKDDALLWNGTAFSAAHGTDATSKITNVKDGDLTAGSTDAVNGSQLKTTNDAVAANTTNIATNTTNITNLTDAVDSLGDDSLLWNATAGAFSAAHGTDATSKITNVKDGDLTAGSTDAVNGSQLKTTNDAVAANTTNIATNTTNITNLTDAVDSLGDDALLWDATANDGNGAFSAAHGKDKTASVITNVANGAISATSSDAINGSQLYTTNKYIADALGGDAEVNADGSITAPTYTIANAEYNNVGDALDALDDNALLWDATANDGAGAYNASHDGKASIITNVADGNIGEGSTDAINGSQLFNTNMLIQQNSEIINQLAGNTSETYIEDNGAGINYVRTNDNGLAFNDASASGIGATAVGYNAVASGESSVAIGQGSSSSVDTGIALGSSSVSSRVIVKGSRDTSVSEEGVVIGYDTTDGELLGALSIGDDGKYRQIINVADGSEAHDAVTVRQLQNAIGAVATTPTKYFHANSTEEDSLAVGEDSLAMGAKTIVNGNVGIGIGYGAYVDANALNGIAIGSNARANHANSIAMGSGSQTTRGAQTGYTAYNMDAPQNSVGEFSVGSEDGQRQITNVAAGSADTDAVNVGQLKVTDAQVSQNTQSITNLNNQVTNLDTRVTNIENGIGDIVTTGSTKYFKTNTDGVDANAQGKDSVAIGSGSIAAADNSVALGTGSVANEENTISVGSSTNQRRITNVAAGVNATDAVNVSQLKSSEAGGVRYDTKADGSIDYSNITLGGGNGGTTRISNVSAGVNNNDAVNYAQLKQSVQETKQYTDQRMVEMDNKLSKTESKLSGGIASAMAMTGLPQAYTPGASMASIGGGTYNGESAVALGVSMVSANGRWVYKLQGSTNSQGEYSAALGAGIQW